MSQVIIYPPSFRLIGFLIVTSVDFLISSQEFLATALKILIKQLLTARLRRLQMPSTSAGRPMAGRIVKSSRAKKGTTHQKNHRWESFTAKVAKLSSLDPLRTVRRFDLEAESLETTTSYFGTGLEKWQELNLSENFVEFSREVAPLADSLPQILHFEDKIMNLLMRYLEKKDRESVEPLLNLLTDFARDLGTRFEKHYSRALKMVTSIAGIPQDVEVVEWTFTCLAFMFKYLSKLLVPDLRPTYDLIAPLLGKEKQQPHIARFAAEAMSFLVRKAGSAGRKENALPLIIKHAKNDLLSMHGSKTFILYYHGVMTMFAEAMKGTGLTIHTAGPAILKAMFEELDVGDDIWDNVLCGVQTSLVHHSSAETLKDIVDVVVKISDDYVIEFGTAGTPRALQMMLSSSRSIGVISGVRKGSRISDWPVLLEAMKKVLVTISKTTATTDEQQIWRSTGLSASILLQYAPMDALIPFVDPFLGTLTKDPFSSFFLMFCSFFATLDVERFRSIVLPYFQRYIVTHWAADSNEDTLLVVVPRLVSTGAILSSYGGKDGFNVPQSWQDQIVSKFERLEVSPFPEQASPASVGKSPKVWNERCLPKYDALLKLMDCGAVHPSTNARIAEILLRKLKLALRPSSSLAPEEAHFIAGRGFNAFSRMSRGAGMLDPSLEPLLRAAAPRYARLPNFLDAMLTYINALPASNTKQSDIDGNDDLLVASLIENLSTESHELRLASLRLLDVLSPENECVSIMLLVENTPLDLQTARSASMHIRKLASMFASRASDKILGKAIPYFCFGMLTVKFAQIWEDASAALSQIVQTKAGETHVAELAVRWLEAPSRPWDGGSAVTDSPRSTGLTDFECSNLMHLEQTADDVETDIKEAQSSMLSNFEEEQRQVSDTPSTARTQAIKVLSLVPHIAEKRSRQIVPMFLSWAQREEEDEQVSDWTKRDQRGLLDLIALFVNPRVLYLAAQVQSALYVLLANGDLETQKSALKAINTWKFPGVRPYEENLQNLLDEARFKDEITILLGGQTLIQSEHREELMPILLRLLYGRTISRKGAASGKQGMEARRLIVLRNLNIHDIGAFLDIALGDLKDINLDDEMLSQELISVRKQVGFIHMMEAVLKELASKVTPYTEKLATAVLYCLVYVSRQLNSIKEEGAGEEDVVSQTSMLKAVRQTGFRCLVLLFTNDAAFAWASYMPVILKELVSPRLELLPTETAQSVSGVLHLLNAWSHSPKTVLYLSNDDRILPKIAECLEPPKSQDAVKLFALGIIRNVIHIAGDGREVDEKTAAQVRDSLLSKHMDTILGHISSVLRAQQDVSKDLLEACVDIVSQLAPFVVSTSQAQNLVDISIFLLDQPTKRVNPKTKSGLLRILEHFVPLYDLQDNATLKDKIYNTITSLFGFFKDQASREVLSRVLLVYSREDSVLEDVAEICMSLNSFKDARLDEPDYDRRLAAFTDISKHSFTAYQWRPLLYNMLFYIRHDEEFGILSSNSSDGICNFLNAAREGEDFEPLLSSILLPALYAGAKESSEVIRREYVKVMQHLVREFSNWSEVSDMVPLLKGDDELETSFFNNILTAGKGRQSSALSLLSETAPQLSSKNVSHFFIPLIEHFIMDRAEGNDAHSLAAEATNAVGVLAGSLEWPQYRAYLRRYIDRVVSKPELEKQIIRLVGRVTDALADAKEISQNTLAKCLPKEPKFTNDITSNVLPPLMTYLHDKDESTVSLRVPVAIIIVRVLKLLPQEQLTAQLPAVLTDICHILRSKSQESRDMTRDTLVKICVLLGPSCFGFVLKELRGALARGYQLHVLSYTLHSMLVATTPEYEPGDLDYCLPTIVAIIMDDIFGATGQEKDAEEYVSKMKEVKSSKSHDSMELIAKTATLSRLTDLVRPIQDLLKERLDLRMVRKIDELLGRVSSGLIKNSAAASRDSLVFCYEVVMDARKVEPERKDKTDPKLKRYLIQKGAKKINRSSTTVYTYKLVRFALDVLRTVLKKHDDLRTTSDLTGFFKIVGDALLDSEEEVKVAAFKLLTTIIKVPLKDDIYKVGVLEAISSISISTTTTSDIAQAGLKLVSVVLRDRKSIIVKDTQVDKLLTRLKDDLTEPERRHVTFNFLRCVLDARVESAVVYDTLDYVGTVMVTNDDKDTRSLARGAYFQFLREYPQTKKRWSKQLRFIVANLGYEREGGRESILEVIHLLLSKSSFDFVQEVSVTCFLPLSMAMINDSSERCRMAAAEVIKEIFKRASEDNTKTFIGLMKTWTSRTDNSMVLRLGLQSFGLYYEATEKATDFKFVEGNLSSALQSDDWEVVYIALQLALKMCTAFLEDMLASNLWSDILACLSFPHSWVKLPAAKLAGIYFSDLAKNTPELTIPLSGSKGTKLGAREAQDLIRRNAGIFKTPQLSEELATEAVKNLAFLGRVADQNSLPWKPVADEDDNEEEAPQRTALEYLLSRLSFILRQESSPPRAHILVPKTASLQLMTALCNRLSSETLLPLLPTVLRPLHNLTDPSIASPYSTDEDFRNGYEKLKTDSAELMSTLQSKLGTAEYTKQFLGVREEAKARRTARSSKRKIEAISAPEKYGEDKRKKTVRKKERRKERGMEHRDARHAY